MPLLFHGGRRRLYIVVRSSKNRPTLHFVADRDGKTAALVTQESYLCLLARFLSTINIDVELILLPGHSAATDETLVAINRRLAKNRHQKSVIMVVDISRLIRKTDTWKSFHANVICRHDHIVVSATIPRRDLSNYPDSETFVRQTLTEFYDHHMQQRFPEQHRELIQRLDRLRNHAGLSNHVLPLIELFGGRMLYEVENVATGLQEVKMKTAQGFAQSWDHDGPRKTDRALLPHEKPAKKGELQATWTKNLVKDLVHQV